MSIRLGTTSRYFSSTEAGGGPEEQHSALVRTKKRGPATTKRRAKSSSDATAESSSSASRTKSFQPAWWGNIIATPPDAKSVVHSHATAASVDASIAMLKTRKRNDPSNQEFPPVHTLILGTHPSVVSLDRNEMYAHPQNAFWYIAGDCLGFRRSAAVSSTTGKPYASFHDHLRYHEILDYQQQLEQMVSRGFALWDIVAECERVGSLDTDIKGEVVNPIREFCEGSLYDGIGSELISIKRIVIANGTTGAKMFVKHFASWFEDGKLCAGKNEMSKRVFKGVMNKAKKANNNSSGDGALNERLIEVVCLPGVSPAAAKFTYLEKRDEWERGCYFPGLKDYEDWNKSRQHKLDTCETPKKIKSETSTSEVESNERRTPSKMPTVRLLSSDLATLAPENEWIDLEVPAQELRPSATLTTGQCFNWLVVEGSTACGAADTAALSPQKSAWGTHDAKEWVGTPLKDRVISIRETATTTLFRVLCGPKDGAKEELRSYFRLETPLAPLYEEWSKQDARLARIAKAIPGVRIVRQDPHECLFSFICSSNNNIPRITKMLSSFREKYGMFMMELPTRQDHGEVGTLSLFSFPTLSSLADATESDLRMMGLGYRAKFIIETRDLLKECGGDDYLLNFRTQQDAEAVQEELIKFSGIGRKVADCIALFSLDQDDAIPVDVHVQHIASRDYDPTVLGEAKSITPTIYRRVGNLFRDRFTHYPGWAHSLLFVAELPSFRDVLPDDVVTEMDHWRKEEQRKMRAMKEEKNNKTT
jgi:N-glycosylase/DNA lyase